MHTHLPTHARTYSYIH